MITKIFRNLKHSPLKYPLTLYMPFLFRNQICSVSDEKLIKRVDKLLEAFFRQGGLHLALLLVQQYKQFSKDGKMYSSMESFAMNEKIDLCLGLITKLPFSTGYLKDLLKKSLLCPMKTLVCNPDVLLISQC